MTKLARARCPGCHRVLAVRPPAGGDASADVFPRHTMPGGDACDEGRQEVHPSEYVDA